MINWIKNNRSSITFGGIAVSALILASLVSGCQLDDMIKFSPPADVQTALGTENSVSLSEANYVWDEWERYVSTNSQRLTDEIGDAHLTYELIASLSNTGLEMLGQSAGTFPGGALIFGGLSLLSGLYLKRPGTDKHVSAEKQASFNKGLAEGKRVAIEMYEEMTNANTES